MQQLLLAAGNNSYPQMTRKWQLVWSRQLFQIQCPDGEVTLHGNNHSSAKVQTEMFFLKPTRFAEGVRDAANLKWEEASNTT